MMGAEEPGAPAGRRSGRPLVWVIGAEQWPRACLRAELLERGYQVAGFEGLAQAVRALARPGAPWPDAIVLDLRGQLAHCDALAGLRRSGARVVLMGGAVELDEWASHGLTPAVVLRRPVTVGEVVAAVDRLVAEGSGRS